jgi:hypothetical protein
MGELLKLIEFAMVKFDKSIVEIAPLPPEDVKKGYERELIVLFIEV